MLSFPTTPIQEEDTFVSVAFGEDLKMYHNEPVNNKMEAGKATHYSPLEVPITVKVKAVGDVIDDLKWSFTAQSGRLGVSGDFKGRTLIAACYDANGRMLEVQTLTTEGEKTLSRSKDSAKIKLFLLDSDSKPVCSAVTVKGSTD